MKPLALIIDHDACRGCLACEAACKRENNADPGIKFIRVTEEAVREKNGKPFSSFNVVVCRHTECEGTRCAEVRPNDAITVRGDGIVVMDTNERVGCNLCPRACPYEAIVINENESVTQKRNPCHHRVDNGLLPACRGQRVPGALHLLR